ncbi:MULTISPECIES: helix-turn-helix transcriptional regulator [Streptomyces]|uniref:helix-turn-helix transcriptional regulator n=1 Tax=Streptomyces TaxID=1883 RepID=UPI000B9E3786|nr:helix-turn-helix transcriptional regulator [Streptomyces kasugaensis]
MKWSDYSTGERIKILRGKEITQIDLAEMTGLSLATIQKHEQNKRISLGTLTRIADALHTNMSVLLGQSQVTHGREAAERAMLRDLSHSVHAVAMGDVPDEVTPASDTDLVDIVDSAWEMYWDTEYDELGAVLPKLLATARQSIHAAAAGASQNAVGAMSDSFQIAAYLANQFGMRDLAYAAISHAKGYATQCGDVLRTARVEAARSWIYRRDRRAPESLDIAQKAAALVEPSYSESTPERLTVYGNLMSHCAVAASRSGKKDLAIDCLSQSHAIAARLGHEHQVRGIMFGPVSAATKALDVKIYVGDIGQALELIKTVRGLDQLRPAARHRYRLDVALAQAEASMWDASLDTLHGVATAAPQWVRNQALAAGIVQRVGNASTARLRQVSELIGVRPYL